MNQRVDGTDAGNVIEFPNISTHIGDTTGSGGGGNMNGFVTRTEFEQANTRIGQAERDIRNLFTAGMVATGLVLSAIAGLYFHNDHQTRQIVAELHNLNTSVAILVDRERRSAD